METVEKSSTLQSRLLKQKRLCVQVKVVGNATPASKARSSDLAGIANISTAGQTTESAALGVTIVQTNADSTGLFTVILDKAAIGEVSKINKAQSVAVSGGGTSSVSSAYISNGHICIDIDSSVDLTGANTAEIQLIVDYQKK
jgi:hypothetical protein